MNKGLFDLLKKYIFENADEYSTYSPGDGHKYSLEERPDNDNEIIGAEIEGDLLTMKYYKSDRENIIIFSNMARLGEEVEHIIISKLNDEVKADVNIKSK